MTVELLNQHADRLGQVGLHFLWQGTIIAILAAMAGRFLLTNPRHRACLYLGSLVALFLCVPITHRVLATPAPVQEIAPAISPLAIEVTPTLSPGPSDLPTLPVRKNSPLTPAFWMIAVYFVGLALMLVRVVQGYYWSSKIRKNGKVINKGPWCDALAQALSRMKLRSRPLMVWSEKVASPVVTGILRPMIVLPVSLMSNLPREQAIAILSHELAHLRRFDHLIVVFQRLLEALFFFHPAVWFLSRRLDQEREKACDDLVVQAGTNRADYAEALVKIGSNHQPTLALAAAKSAHLKTRIFRILNHSQPTTVRVNRGGWLTIAAVIGGLGFLSLSPALSEEKEVEKVEEPKEEETGRAVILKKLEIRIPQINFQNATLEEAVSHFRTRSIELDPDKEGINWVVRRRPGHTNEIKIESLVGKNLTIKEALEAVCEKTKTRYRVDNYAVTVLPQLAPGEEDTWVVQRSWKTLPDFPALITATGISPRSRSIAGHLKALGVGFPQEASASYLTNSATLIVRNTPKNLELIDEIIKNTRDPKTAKALRDRAESSEAERLATEVYDKLLIQRKWTTPPDFLDKIAVINGVRPSSTEDCLKIHGITFFGNSSASFLSESRTLVVRNTEENLELIDALVKEAMDPDFGKKRQEAVAATKKNLQELQEIIIPEIELQEATLAEAVEFLNRRSLEVDSTKKGVKINIAHENLAQTKIINLRLINVPLTVVLEYVCRSTMTRYTVEGREISIVRLEEPQDPAAETSQETTKLELLERGAEKAILQKLRIKIPVIELNQATLEEAIAFLRVRSIALDPEPDPNKKGLNFVLRKKPGAHQDPNALIVDSLVARGFTIKQVLDAICIKTKMKYRVDEFAVTLIPLTKRELANMIEGADFVTRRWKTPENFIGFVTPKAAKGRPVSIQSLMEALGVGFPYGSAISYDGESRILTCQNTVENLVLMDAIVAESGSLQGPPEPAEEKGGAEVVEDSILNDLVIPKIDFHETTLAEAVEFLRLRSFDLDPKDPKQGVNINIFNGNEDLSKRVIKRLDLANVPVRVALAYICDSTKTRYRVEGRNISILPRKE